MGVIVVETVGICFWRWYVIVVNVVPHVPHLGYNLCSVATNHYNPPFLFLLFTSRLLSINLFMDSVNERAETGNSYPWENTVIFEVAPAGPYASILDVLTTALWNFGRFGCFVPTRRK